MQWSFEKRIIGLIVSLALFMDALDTTIINTAIPAMAASLRVHPVDLKIALISYLLSLAVFIPISGWIAEKFGIKRVFIVALSIFTLSSFFCGYATNLLQLVCARTVQGLGGSLMLPLGRFIILRTFKRHELVQAMSSVIMVVSIGVMLGPLVGGIITDQLSWSWIFWVNIPVGILAILMTSRFLKPVAPKKVKPLDFIGFILFGGGLAALTFALSDLSESTASETIALTILCTAIAMLSFYFYRAKKQVNPIIDLNLFSIRTFRISVFGNLCARLGFGGVPFLLPLLLQVGLGYSAQLSGLLLMPLAIGILLVKAVSLPVMRWVGFRRLLMVNTFLVGFALWLFLLVNQTTPLVIIAAFTFCFGFLISLQYSGMNSLAYADITPEQHGSATSIMSTMQQIAQSFGVAMSALLLRFFSSLNGQNFPLTTAVFHRAFLALSFLTFLSTLVFINLKQGDGASVLIAPKKDTLQDEH